VETVGRGLGRPECPVERSSDRERFPVGMAGPLGSRRLTIATSWTRVAVVFDWDSRFGRALRDSCWTLAVVVPLGGAGAHGKLVPYGEPRTLYQIVVLTPLVAVVVFGFCYWAHGGKAYEPDLTRKRRTGKRRPRDH
jgi:hypothetical protein